MRCLFITNLYPPNTQGGYEIECQQVATELFNRGYFVAILTSSTPEANYPYPIFDCLSLLQPFEKRVQGRAYLQKHFLSKHNFKKTIEVLHKFQPDIVFHWSPLRIGLGSARACQETSLPIVWRFGDSNIEGFIPQQPHGGIKAVLQSCLEKLLWRDFTTDISFHYASCISQHTKQDLIRRGLPLTDAQVIHKGISLADFPLKNNPGMLHTPLRLLYVGQILPEKGIETAIQALKIYNKTTSSTSLPMNLTIVGKGQSNYLARLESSIEHAGLTSCVQLQGYIPHEQLSAVYQAHDIFLFPSMVEEGQGTTYLEAMSSGLPVIGTPVGGAKELLQDGYNALLFLPGNPVSLTDKIKELSQNERLRYQIIQNGLKTVSQLDFTSYADQLEKMLVTAFQQSRMF